MIEQMEHNFIGKQKGFRTDRTAEECAWPRSDRQSVCAHENLVNLSSLGRIVLAPTEPSREQVCDRPQDPTAFPAQTAPLGREFAADLNCSTLITQPGPLADPQIKP